MIKLFIIDDHQMIIEGIYSLLKDEKGIEWMGSAMDPDDLMAFLQSKQPDVLLMDINLPNKSGLDLCKEVKQKYPGIYIIGLSTSDQGSIIRKMLDNGASGYLSKDASKNEITDAIHAVVKGKNYINFSVSKNLANKTEDNSLPVLTRREREVLELIAEGLTNGEIADKLFLHVSTVDSHRKNMLTKYNMKNTAALITLAAKNNLI